MLLTWGVLTLWLGLIIYCYCLGRIRILSTSPVGLFDPIGVSIIYAKEESNTTMEAVVTSPQTNKSRSGGLSVSQPVIKPVADNKGQGAAREQIMEYLCDPKFNWNCQLAKAITWCESKWGQDRKTNFNKNGSNDKGLWGINSIHGLGDACRLDNRCSTDFAYKLWKRQGWKPWNSNWINKRIYKCIEDVKIK